MVECEYCGAKFYPGDGAWDDGDYMCPGCISGHIEEAEKEEREQSQEPKLSMTVKVDVKRRH